MQFYVYYIIFIATSIKSQISVIKSNDGTPKEIGLTLGPASVSLKLSGTTDSGETIPPKNLSSTINSNELATNEITPNIPEIDIVADENQVPVEAEGLTEMTDNSETTVSFTSAIVESGSSSTIRSSEATESAYTDIKYVLNKGSESTNSPSILAGSSTTTISLPAPGNLLTQATTTVPIAITTMGDISEVSTESNSTIPSSTRTESGYVMTAATSETTEPSSLKLNTEATAISVQFVSPSISYPTSVITSSASTSKTTKLPSFNTEATPISIQFVSSSSSHPTSVSTSTYKTTESSSSLNTDTTPTSVDLLSPNGSYTTSSPTSTVGSSTNTIASISTSPTAHNGTTLSPSLCGENEVYSCLPLCPRTCNNPLSKVLCRPVPSYIAFCRRGCTCMTGYLFEKSINKCLKKCPATLPLKG